MDAGEVGVGIGRAGDFWVGDGSILFLAHCVGERSALHHLLLTFFTPTNTHNV